MKIISLLPFALLLALVSANLTCDDFIYGNSATNIGYMVFGDAGNLTVGNLQAKNLHVAQTKAGSSKAAHSFALRNCSSTSLGISANCIQPSNSFGVFYNTYSTTVQVLDARTGRCMTRLNNTDGTVNFQRCKSDPQDKTQLWGASQIIYSDYIYPVSVYPLEYVAWEVADNAYGTMCLAFDTNGLNPQVTTSSATGVVPNSQDIQQCRV